MRNLFFASLIVVIVLASLNAIYFPSRQLIAKEIVDRHLNSFSVTNAKNITYTGHIILWPSTVYADDIHFEAGFGTWNRLEFDNMILNIERIEYDPSRAMWNGRREVKSIENIEFTADLPYDQISGRMGNLNVNFIDPVLRYDGRNLFLRGYFKPIDTKIELEGKLILTPLGDLKFNIERVLNVDGDDITSKKAMKMLNELTDLTCPVYVLEKRIALDELEMKASGVRIKGFSDEHGTDNKIE